MRGGKRAVILQNAAKNRTIAVLSQMEGLMARAQTIDIGNLRASLSERERQEWAEIAHTVASQLEEFSIERLATAKPDPAATPGDSEGTEPPAAVRAEAGQMNVGDDFNPYREACGFFPADVVGRQRWLGDGPKRVYAQLVFRAGADGRCFPSHRFLADELGKSERQVRYDLGALESAGLVAHRRNGRRMSNNYVFLWHDIFNGDRQDTADHKTGDRQQVAAHRKTGDRQQVAGGDRQDTAGGDRQCIATEIIIRNQSEKPQSQNRSNKSADDDEARPKPGETQTPEVEFRLLLVARHGSNIDPDRVLEVVRKELARGDVSLTTYLEADKLATTAPNRLSNPAGHYRKLARDLVRKQKADTLSRVVDLRRKMEVFTAEPARPAVVVTNPEQACPHCGLPRGKGVLIENGVAVPCPVCSAKVAAA